MKVERSIEIAVPPEDVYTVLMDPRRLGDWVTIHEELKSAPNGALTKGSQLQQALKVAGRRFDVTWKVTEAEQSRRAVWEGRGPARTKARAVYELSKVDGGTRFDYLNEYQLPGGPLGGLAGRAVARVAAREVRKSLERLKAYLER